MNNHLYFTEKQTVNANSNTNNNTNTTINNTGNVTNSDKIESLLKSYSLDAFDFKDIWQVDYLAKGGADMLQLCLGVEWKNHEQLMESLTRAKEVAAEDYTRQQEQIQRELADRDNARKQTNSNNETSSEIANDPTNNFTNREDDFIACDRNAVIEFDGHNLQIQPYGQNTGDSKYSYYSLVAREFDFRYFFKKRTIEQCSTTGNLNVIIGSKPLMKWGDEFCYKIMIHAIKAMGGEVVECKITRVDLCADLPNVSIDAFQNAISDKRYVCKARRFAGHRIDSETTITERHSGRKNTGVEIGKANIRCRIYDKIIEMNVKHDEDKINLMFANRYGEKMPECATRVEFQIRREGLRNFNVFNKCHSVITFDDYLKVRGDIMNYLVNDWLRLYKDDFDKTHTSRLTKDDLLPEWQMVIDTFNEIANGDGKLVTTKKPKDKPKREHLLKQAIGCLNSIIAVSDKNVTTPQEIISEFKQEICKGVKSYGSREIKKRVSKKRAKYRAGCVVGEISNKPAA